MARLLWLRRRTVLWSRRLWRRHRASHGRRRRALRPGPDVQAVSGAQAVRDLVAAERGRGGCWRFGLAGATARGDRLAARRGGRAARRSGHRTLKLPSPTLAPVFALALTIAPAPNPTLALTLDLAVTIALALAR